MFIKPLESFFNCSVQCPSFFNCNLHNTYTNVGSVAQFDFPVTNQISRKCPPGLPLLSFL
jgi:hypothetical protein